MSILLASPLVFRKRAMAPVFELCREAWNSYLKAWTVLAHPARIAAGFSTVGSDQQQVIFRCKLRMPPLSFKYAC